MLFQYRVAAAAILGAGLLAASPVWANPGDDTIQLGSCAMNRSFYDDFQDLHVNASVNDGRGWTAHTPWNGDFGDAAFTDPRPGFPFTVEDGILHITARKDDQGKWRSGLLSSTDAAGRGFAQQYGYFELKAQLPKGEGVWPAFWLATAHAVEDKSPAVEIDALEHYGRFASDFHSGIHVWNVPPPVRALERVVPVQPDALSSGFHAFGVDVERDWITYYFDRRVTWRTPTPAEHTRPLGILINLALGAGWPIDRTPNPSIMKVASVAVYQRTATPCASDETAQP